MYPTSAEYGPFVRSGGIQYTVCDAWYGGAIVPGGADLPIDVKGNSSVTDDSKPGVRRTLSLDLVKVPGLDTLLAPTGTQLRPRSVTRYPDGSTESIPMGVFDVDSQSMDYGPTGGITLQASDKWARIQRAQFIVPEPAVVGSLVSAQIVTLIRGALGTSEPVNNYASSQARTGAWYWAKDRAQTILDLAESIGVSVYFDRNGVATIEDLPTADAGSVWLVDASASGVLLGATRAWDRSSACNVIVVSSDAVDGVEPFPPQIVWDNDPSSVTYAGPDPFNNPAGAGPFGVVPDFYSSPLLHTASDGLVAGRTILARKTGLAATMQLSAVRHHGLDSLDPIDVLLPPQRYDLPRVVVHQIIDKVVHPLTPDGAQTISARSLRAADYT